MSNGLLLFLPMNGSIRGANASMQEATMQVEIFDDRKFTSDRQPLRKIVNELPYLFRVMLPQGTRRKVPEENAFGISMSEANHSALQKNCEDLQTLIHELNILD